MPDPTDAKAASSAAAVEPKEPLQQTPEESLPPDAKAETRERFQKLLDDRKSLRDRVQTYEQYGSPEEIAALKEKVQQVDILSEQIAALQAVREPGEPKSDEQKKLETLRAEAKTQLREIDEGIAQGEWAASVVAQQYEGLEEDALETQVELMKNHGMATTDRDIRSVGGSIAAEIKADRRLLRLYQRDPSSAVEKGFERVMQRFAGPLDRKQKAEIEKDKAKLAALPKSHGGGGGPGPTKASEAPQTVDEGVKRLMARFREQRG